MHCEKGKFVFTVCNRSLPWAVGGVVQRPCPATTSAPTALLHARGPAPAPALLCQRALPAQIALRRRPCAVLREAFRCCPVPPLSPPPRPDRGRVTRTRAAHRSHGRPTYRLPGAPPGMPTSLPGPGQLDSAREERTTRVGNPSDDGGRSGHTPSRAARPGAAR